MPPAGRLMLSLTPPHSVLLLNTTLAWDISLLGWGHLPGCIPPKILYTYNLFTGGQSEGQTKC